MALSNLFCSPTAFNAQPLFSVANASVLNGIQAKIVPLNFDGSKWDCTGATSVTMYWDNNIAPGNAGYLEESIASAIITADATGLQFTSTATAIQTKLALLQASNNATNGRLSISVSDGTNSQLVATGTWSLKNTA